jgi:hypothetical protein
MNGRFPLSSREQVNSKFLPSIWSEEHPERSAGHSMSREAVDAKADSMTIDG